MKDKCHRLNSVSVKLMAHARGFCCISLHATVLLTREKPMMGKKKTVFHISYLYTHLHSKVKVYSTLDLTPLWCGMHTRYREIMTASFRKLYKIPWLDLSLNIYIYL